MYQLVTDESVEADNEFPPAPGYVNPSMDDDVYKNFSNESKPFLTSFILFTVLSLSFLSSKSIVVETTNSAVELKVLIEQMREQIQNIE